MTRYCTREDVDLLERTPTGKGSIFVVLALLAMCFCTSAKPGNNPKAGEPSIIEELLRQYSPPPDWEAHIRDRLERGVELPNWEPRSIEPPDNAPLAELIAFWREPPFDRLEEVDDNFHPSAVVARRLVNAIVDAPELAKGLGNDVLMDREEWSNTAWTSPPEPYPTGDEVINAEVVRAYEALKMHQPKDEPSIEMFHRWLMLNTDHFRDDLIRTARSAFADSKLFSNGHFSILALRRLSEADPPKAKSILKKIAKSDDSRRRIEALGELLKIESEALVWRQQLEAIALDEKVEFDQRKTAVRALLEVSEGSARRRIIDRFRVVDDRLVSWTPERKAIAKALKDAQEIVAFLERLRKDPLEMGWVWPALRNHEKFAVQTRKVKGLAGRKLALQIVIGRDRKRAIETLHGDDFPQQAMLLVCARHVRLPLPLDLVIPLLDSENQLVAHAAAHFLESDDSLAARAELQRRHPGAALITGAWTKFDPGMGSFSGFRRLENISREKVKRGEVDEVIALLSSGHWGDNGNRIIEIRDGKAMLYHQENGFAYSPAPLRYRERELSREEIRDLRQFIEKYSVTELPPYDTGTYDGIQFDFYRVTKSGGRRVFMNNPPKRSSPWNHGRGTERQPGDIYGILVEKFFDLEKAKPMKLRYHNLEALPGFRVLAQQKENTTYAVTGEDGKIKVLRQTGSKYSEKAVWYHLEDGRISTSETGAPSTAPTLYRTMPYGFIASGRKWQMQVGDRSISTGKPGESAGLHFNQKDRKPVRLAEGEIRDAVISADGKWAAATTDGKLFVVELDSSKRTDIELPTDGKVSVLAYLEVHDCFLIEHGDVFRFLFPDSKKTTVPMGNLYPFISPGWRPLQPTGEKDEVWVAELDAEGEGENLEKIWTNLCRYNTATFALEKVQRLPGVAISSDEMWVDGKAGLIYIILDGDLLQLSLMP